MHLIETNIGTYEDEEYGIIPEFLETKIECFDKNRLKLILNNITSLESINEFDLIQDSENSQFFSSDGKVYDKVKFGFGSHLANNIFDGEISTFNADIGIMRIYPKSNDSNISYLIENNFNLSFFNYNDLSIRSSILKLVPFYRTVLGINLTKNNDLENLINKIDNLSYGSVNSDYELPLVDDCNFLETNQPKKKGHLYVL